MPLIETISVGGKQLAGDFGCACAFGCALALFRVPFPARPSTQSLLLHKVFLTPRIVSVCHIRFDPLGLADSPKQLAFYREAEIKVAVFRLPFETRWSPHTAQP